MKSLLAKNIKMEVLLEPTNGQGEVLDSNSPYQVKINVEITADYGESLDFAVMEQIVNNISENLICAPTTSSRQVLNEKLD
jgi:uncharacterized alkaline shock family protein YloU